MNTRSLTWHDCATHGRHLADSTPAGLRCVSCYTTEAATKPAPTCPRKRKAGSRGRPRQIGLTDIERTVAELVSKGAMQREIAVQLGVGRASVSMALRRAMDRLGVTNRVDLAMCVRGGA